MTPEQLFDLIDKTIQQAVNSTPDLHVYTEREMRGTYPSMAIRMISADRATKKTRADAKIISSVKTLPVELPPQETQEGSEEWKAPPDVPTFPDGNDASESL